MAAHENATGQRLLDYLDLHYYPQHQDVALSPAGGVDRQNLRLESTRSLVNFLDISGFIALLSVLG